MITQTYLKPLGLGYSSVVAETLFPLVCDEDTMLRNSNLGNFIADAIYYYVNSVEPQGADITLFPAGMVRDRMEPGLTGKQNVADIFRIVSLGNGKDNIPGYPVAKVYITAKELKGILEILYLAPSSSKSNYIYFSGIRAKYDPEKGLLKKIVNIEIGNEQKGFKTIDVSDNNKDLYSLTANSYMLEFIGIIKKLSHGLVKVTLKNAKGEPIQNMEQAWIDTNPDQSGIQEAKEWTALLKFIQSFPDKNGNGIPDIPEYYRIAGPRLSAQ